MATIYIAGPMSGLIDFNFPAFHSTAKRLRADGHSVVNPAEVVAETDQSWDYYMRKDIPELLKCDSIYLLRGWTGSKGARLEKIIAETLGMEVRYEALT